MKTVDIRQSIKINYTLMTFCPETEERYGGYFVIYHKDGQDLKENDEYELNDFLPLTPESKNILSMVYPDLPVEALKDALDKWEYYLPNIEHYYFTFEDGEWS